MRALVLLLRRNVDLVAWLFVCVVAAVFVGGGMVYVTTSSQEDFAAHQEEQCAPPNCILPDILKLQNPQTGEEVMYIRAEEDISDVSLEAVEIKEEK